MADWPAEDYPTRIRHYPDADPAAGAASGTFFQMISADNAGLKGDWVELISSTPFAVSEIILRIVDWYNINASTLIDIGIGASGQEQVVVPDIAMHASQNNSTPQAYRLPISIPAGARISGRCASGNTVAQWNIVTTLVAASLQSPARNTRAVAFGTTGVTGTSVNIVNNGNPFGGYTLLGGPTTFTIKELLLCATWTQGGTPTEGVLVQVDVVFGPTNTTGGGYRPAIRAAKFRSSPQGWRLGYDGPHRVHIPAGSYIFCGGTTPNNSFGNPRFAVVGFG